jgi:hypothetical protein
MFQDFQQQLFGAWCACGLDAAPDVSGSLIFVCPRCPHPRPLEVEDRLVHCKTCEWAAAGDAWDVAQEGAKAKPAPAAATTLPLLKLSEILAYEPDPRDEIWPGGILSAGDATCLVGAPGVGKSRLALQGAICTILGRPFLGWETKGEGLKWLFLQTENSTRRLKADLGAMTSHLTIAEREQIDTCLRILNVSALEFGSVCMVDGHPDRPRILDGLAAYAPDIVPIDPLRDAGSGDPNKDADMTETCKAIGTTLRASNPRRVPFVIHHGRTGAAEASRVYGDDSASFARNSKVLYGWLRSQINIAAAGADWPGVIIVGCGKNSNGPKWEPFAAELDPFTMTYHRLESFDLAKWAEKMAGIKKAGPRSVNLPTPQAVASVIVQAGGEVMGAVNASEGLVKRLQREYGVTRLDAQSAIEAAVGETIELKEFTRAAHGGGKPVRMYVINANDGRKYEPRNGG